MRLRIPEDDDECDAGSIEEQAPFLLPSTIKDEPVYLKPSLWTIDSHAIPIFYLLLGFLQSYPRVALRQFTMQDLHASPALQQIMLSVIMVLPWQFKVLYGFLSDAFPIYGQHRKPYMLLGVAIYSLSWICLGIFSAVHPTVGTTCFLLFTGTFGLIFTDVMSDTLVVERMKAEVGTDIGSMQTLCWCMRFIGNLVGLVIGGIQISEAGTTPSTIFLTNGLVPLMVLPSLLYLKDEGNQEHKENNDGNDGNDGKGTATALSSASSKLWAVWDVMAEPWLFRPMLFVFVNAATPSSSDAFVNFMLLPTDKDGLGISMGEYSVLLAIGQVASIAGACLYQWVFSGVQWRTFFYVVMFISLPISLTQLIVIFKMNEQWGVSSFAFLFGSEVVGDTMGFLIQMPILIMSAKLSPKNIEGTVYALQVSTNNIGGSVSGQLGALLTQYYDVTSEHLGNLWKLTLVCIALGMLPMLFVPCLPEHAEHKVKGVRSHGARLLLFGVLVGSLVLNTLSSIVELVEWGGGLPSNSSGTRLVVDSVTVYNATSVNMLLNGHANESAVNGTVNGFVLL